MALCVVCQENACGYCMCDRCGRAFQSATGKDDGTIAATIGWAARQARKYERARVKRRAARVKP